MCQMAGNRISRLGFLGEVAAALGGMALPFDLFATDGRPLLKLGVLSDIHIGARKEAPTYLENALRWLSDRGVEAVLSPGDVAHNGYVSQMEEFAAIWSRVFPGGRAGDGRKVELMISTGNHDAWDHKLNTPPGDWRKGDVIRYPERVWEELFDQRWDPVWRREVNGLTFVGSQWPTLKPDFEGFMARHGREFDPKLPFFHCQHEHPRGTCHGEYGGCGQDKGQAGRALSAHPNAVVFSGHSHCSLVDERAVWQGAFTSIGSGCLHEGGLAFSHENCSAFWHPCYRKRLMRPLNDPEAWGGDREGGCFLFVEVYADHLVLHRRSALFDLPMGPDWVVPVPARPGGPLDFKLRAAQRCAPEFPAEAAVAVRLCPQGHELEGIGRRGEPCIHVSFPAAKPVRGCRVFDYSVVVKSRGKYLKGFRIFAAGGVLPEEKSDRPGECLVALGDLPAGQDVTVTVIPRECFGLAGRPIESRPLTLPA